MKVSIITSCLNREETIGQAIESVLSQDYPDIEYIVVDGASRDGSLQVIDRYRDRIARVISEPDKGMYEAINKGIRAATGDIIGLLHSDDFLFERHIISDIVKRFKETHADMVYGNGLFVNAKRTELPVRDWTSGTYRKWKVKCGWLPLHPTVYIRRGVIEERGLYDERYRIAADTDLLLRYLERGDLRVSYLNKYIVRMRMGGLSTDIARRKQMWKEDVDIYSRHGYPGVPAKLMKMAWKVPQFVAARLERLGVGRTKWADEMDEADRGLFCHFLRQGLWGEEEAGWRISGLKDEDWERIYDMGHRQAVSGVLTDGIALGKARPQGGLWGRWIARLVGIRQMNCHLAREAAVWLERLEEAGIEAEVFKGPSVAHWYNRPLYRSFGDLDIVVSKGWEGLERMLKASETGFFREHGDIVLRQNNVLVEFHPQREFLYNPLTHHRLTRLLREDGKGHELYLACLILHLRRHVLAYGIGLKQVCDVAVMLRYAPLDRAKLSRLLRCLHMERFSRVLFGFIDTRLKGVDSFPLQPAYGAGLDLLQHVVWKEAYALKAERERRGAAHRTVVGRVIGNGCFWLRRCVLLFGLMPDEACCFPFYMLWRRLKFLRAG